MGRRPMTSESQPMGSATKQPTQLYHPMSAMAWLSRMIELKKTVKVMATPMWKQSAHIAEAMSWRHVSRRSDVEAGEEHAAHMAP